MTTKEAVRALLSGRDLLIAETESVVGEVMHGNASDISLASLLVLLRLKGETADEVIGAVKAIRAASEKVTLPDKNTIDTCGTGGDAAGTFNISTVAAIIAVSAGASVAKHGNRSVSSQCGSADVLEKIGLKISVSPALAEQLLQETHFTFLFAPQYHKAMKYVAGVRRELGVRTIFNMLGPLTNPAEVKRQVVGVYDRGLTGIFAKVLRDLESEHCVVLHGETNEGVGMDEASVCGVTYVSELKDGAINNFKLVPEDFGLRRWKLQDLAGGGLDDNAQIVWQLLDGTAGDAKRDAALFAAGIACYVAGLADDISQGIVRARTHLENGDTKRTLEMLLQRHAQLDL
ncbi:MAG: anthranilate phosphoribosyltransferase [Rhizobacter sp.]|nr:anthranilate phosphoribosyltransferase [Chlorobiales bacterium]